MSQISSVNQSALRLADEFLSTECAGQTDAALAELLPLLREKLVTAEESSKFGQALFLALVLAKLETRKPAVPAIPSFS
jgi:hypothetical protein